MSEDFLTIRDGKDICKSCIASEENELIYQQNRENAKTLPGCESCKGNGILHHSIYACGPGYYDDPDPTIYCTCAKGTALNPATKFVVKI